MTFSRMCLAPLLFACIACGTTTATSPIFTEPSADGGGGSIGVGGEGGGTGGGEFGGNGGGGMGGAGGSGGQETDPARVVFATLATWTGDLGGQVGADAKCESEAAMLGVDGGPWRAWLSTDMVPAITWVGDQGGPFVSVGGLVIGEDAADLLDGQIGFPIKTSAGPVWTGTGPDGVSTGLTCGGWSSTVGDGTVGDPKATDSTWTDAGVSPCTELRGLYCVEQ